MASDRHPPVSPLLVDHLATLYPDKVPDLGMTDREVWIAVGRQDVIRKLRQMAQPSAEQHVVLPG